MIEKLDKLNLADNQLQGRGIDMGDYKIITDTILKVTRENGHHTFNFNIEREGHTYNDTIENLIITSGRDSIYYAYLLKYYFTYNDYANDIREKIENSTVTYRPVDIDNGLILNDIFINKGELSNAMVHYLCVETWVQNGDDDIPVEGGMVIGAPGSNAPFTHYDDSSGWVFDTQSCSWITSGGGSIPDYGDINFPNPGWVHGHGSGAEPSPTGYPSNAYGAQALKQFGWSLSNSQLAWWNNQQNGNTRDEMEAFLLQNGFSDENEAFVRAAIDALDQNPDAEIDFPNKVIENFVKNPTDDEWPDTRCVHRNTIAENPTNLYNSLLNNFNGLTGDWLVIELGNLGSDLTTDDWGITSGQIIGDPDPNDEFDIDLPDVFTITINEELDQNGSNLAIMITLAHELIHAYMFDTLSDAGFINFDSNTGAPEMTAIEINNLDCDNLPITNSTNLNTYSIDDRFAIMMCALIENGLADSTDWSHNLFGNSVFTVTTYQQQLEDFIFENHDWNSESNSFKTNAESIFGSDWKTEISEAVSWIGLESTNEYDNYVNYINQLNDPAQQLYLLNIKNKVLNAQDDCE